MNKTTKTLILAVAAAATMGISLPSCPGMDEMKNDIANLGNQQKALNQKVTAMDAQVKKIADDNAKMQQILVEMANRFNEQATAIKTANDNVAALQAQIANMGKKAAPAAKKRR